MHTGHLKKETSPSSDADILKLVLTGDTALFELLVRRYNPYLYKVGRSYGFNHHDTEDLMQEAFVACYLHLQQFRQQASFKTWLLRIMLNQCWHKMQKHSYTKEQPADVLPDNSSFMFTANNTIDKTVTGRELKNVIEACLLKIPLSYRTTFVLRELTGLSAAETAELMHTSVANVKVQLHRAKALLRKEMVKVYAPEDIYEFNLIYCDRIVNSVMQKITALGKHPL